MATRRITTRSTASSTASLSSKFDRKIAPTVKAMKPRNCGTKPRIQRKVARNDPVKFKKPPTAFFYFLGDSRKGYKRKESYVKAMLDLLHLFVVDWRSMWEKGKTMTYEVQYYDTATEKRAEVDMATAYFIKRKEPGEFDEGDSDSEFDA